MIEQGRRAAKDPGAYFHPAPSYSKLKSGDWGVRITGTGKTGDMVNVQRKDGKLSPTKLGQLVWEGNGVQLYAIDKGAPAEEVTI